MRLRPADRAVGARIAHEIVTRAQRRAKASTPQTRRYIGSAGQSFGAFITDGLRLELDGEANDYVGKSMEGGTLIVRTPGRADEPSIGNACFYGARGGDGVHHRHAPASGSRCATAARASWSKAPAHTPAST